jgi:hypothetical protein
MFQSGQSFFAAIKVQDWLKERQEDPTAYDIIFHQKPAAPGSNQIIAVEIELRRKDGKPVEEWLLQELNNQT